jgi:hypothetical protein
MIPSSLNPTGQDMSRPTGERFSLAYLEQSNPLPDSPRARRRVGTLLQQGQTLTHPTAQLRNTVEGELGVKLPVYQSHDWPNALEQAALHDFLDLITVIYRTTVAAKHLGKPALWVASVARIFAEENLAYEVDAMGGVHPAVDMAFQRNRHATVAGLQNPRYKNSLISFERISAELAQQPPNGKEWRATWSAVEGLFRLMFPTAHQLNANEVEAKLGPLIKGLYSSDPTALRAATKLLASFKDWVDGSHNYRHEPGSEEPAQPPTELAIIAISQGASFLRWLIVLDQVAQPATS